MSEVEQEVRTYLRKIEETMPDWLRDKVEEKTEILDEIEQHIWEYAEDIAGSEELQVKHVKLAIDRMGSPRSVTNEFRNRGTPKYYITEELWGLFVKVMVASFVGLMTVEVILVFVLSSVTDPLDGVGEVLLSTLDIYFPILLVLTVIFVWLSREGYIPDQRGYFQSMLLKDKPSDYFKRDTFLSEGIVNTVVGLVFLLGSPHHYLDIPLGPEFDLYFNVFGAVLLVQSLVLYSKIGLTGISHHQLILIVEGFLNLVPLSLVALLWFEKQTISTSLNLAPIIIDVVALLVVIGVLTDVVYKIVYLEYKLRQFRKSGYTFFTVNSWRRC